MASQAEMEALRAASPAIVMLEKLREGTRNFLECTWPGKPDFKFVLVPLNCDELQQAQAAAYRRFAQLEMEISLTSADDFYSELNMQVIARAMRSLDDESRKTRVFPDADELRPHMTPDERNAIASLYVDLNDAANPDPEDLDDELFAQISDAVKKKDVIRLSGIGSRKLASYIISMGDSPTS